MESPDPPAKATVLVVDDELLLRMLAVEFVEDAEYRALQAEARTARSQCLKVGRTSE